jgi:hypothetical protein
MPHVCSGNSNAIVSNYRFRLSRQLTIATRCDYTFCATGAAMRGERKGPASVSKPPHRRGGCGDRAGPSRASALRWPAILHPVAVASDRDDVCVVDETVQRCGGEDRINEHFGPELKGLVGRYHDRSALVAF